MLLVIALVSLPTALPAQSAAKGSRGSQASVMQPDVLVLILDGVGSDDQVSITYAAAVSQARASEDVAALVRDTRWTVRDVKVSTAKTSTPNGASAMRTSARFSVAPLVNRAEGTLPLEPFIIALKRFKTIQVNYLVMSSFEFRGLEDFENDSVKVMLSRSGGSYVYRIDVKNPDFGVINLPSKQVEPVAKPAEKAGMPVSARVLLVIGLALVVGVIAYIVAAWFSRSRR